MLYKVLYDGILIWLIALRSTVYTLREVINLKYSKQYFRLGIRKFCFSNNFIDV